MTDSPESRNIALSVLSAPASFAALVQKGVEKMADFQKIALDFYAHQTAGVIDSWKKMTPGTAFPGFYVMDAAGQGLAHFVALQKEILDLVVQQSAKGFDALRPEIPGMQPEPPNKDSIDVLISEQENEAAIATQMVDQIVADLKSNAEKPVVQHVAMQQRDMRKAQSKRTGAAKQKNDG